MDYPITDVLQMMGRAGRPQYDTHGVAVIMVAEAKKSFYKKFLYEPFPVESALPRALPDHVNAEVVAGCIGSPQDTLAWLGWTFFHRRLLQNPSYYDLAGTDDATVSAYLSRLIADTLRTLSDAGCVTFDAAREVVAPLTLGRIASRYYLSHRTMARFASRLGPGLTLQAALGTLTVAAEFDELPVRHNEDKLNASLAHDVRWNPTPPNMGERMREVSPVLVGGREGETDGRGGCGAGGMQENAAGSPTRQRERLPRRIPGPEDPHTKASLLLQAHLARLDLPISDYITDTKSVLENCLRILLVSEGRRVVCWVWGVWRGGGLGTGWLFGGGVVVRVLG